MLCAELTNDTKDSISAISQSVFFNLREDIPVAKWESGQQLRASQSMLRLVVKPEDLIWLELSLVAAVERVFVERHGSHFEVMSVVNDRDDTLRKKIFAREKAIIDALPHYGFHFSILTRMNYDLKDLISDFDKPAYVRR